MEEFLKDINITATNRNAFLTNFINIKNIKTVCEVGVYKGELAKVLLNDCEGINKYYMVDSWRKLDDWNKPYNVDNNAFSNFYKEALMNTDFAKNKRVILKGKTSEVINTIENESLDLVYIDGDHTLKGITIDLFLSWSKVKTGGFIIGDDFCNTVWQHNQQFEPTFVFPFTLYFAEAVNAKIYALPHNQFLIKKADDGFQFINLSGKSYDKRTVKSQLDILNISKEEESYKSNKNILNVFKWKK